MKLPYGLGPSLFMIVALLVITLILPMYPAFRVLWLVVGGIILIRILWHAWKRDIHS